MHPLGLNFTKPTYTLAKADPQKQEEFKNSCSLEFKLLSAIYIEKEI
ncbi:winged helix-turn-helix domain-containing protein [Lutispora sp.]